MKMILVDAAMNGRVVYVDSVTDAQVAVDALAYPTRWTRGLLDSEDGYTHLWERRRGTCDWYKVTVRTPSIQNEGCCPACGQEIERS